MANVFISYARRDKARVARLTEALEGEGLSVWWDSDLIPGRRYRTVIDEQLEAADAVIVVWTAASVDSDWVQDEAEDGRRRGVLVPVTLDPVRPPAGFRQVQAADLSQWTGSSQHPDFRTLVFAVRSLVQVARAAGRAEARPPPGQTVERHQGPPIAEPPAPAAELAAAAAAPTAAIEAAAQTDAAPPAPAVTAAAPAQPASLDARVVAATFDWSWWLRVTIAMAGCVLLIWMSERDMAFWPVALCAAPVLAMLIAFAGRRTALRPSTRAVVAVLTCGSGLVIGVATSLLISAAPGERIAGGIYCALLAASAVFVVAAGGALLVRLATPGDARPARQPGSPDA